MSFNPDAAARPGSGIFGLPVTPAARAEAAIVLLPVPFDATTSYGGGASAGPGAILRASAQVDLYDLKFGRVYERGIFMEPVSERIASLSSSVRAIAKPLIEKGGAEASDAAAVRRIDAAGAEVNTFTYEATKKVLAEGKVPGLVGGDHSTPFGAIRAVAEARGPIGILHIDAHMDLRDSFEGFRWSHASIMLNVLREVPRVERLVQVGIRDFGEGEMDFAIEQGKRVAAFYDQNMADELGNGRAYKDIVAEIIDALPGRVYVSFDIDGLDPSLCPHTGTPVPGGLSFAQASQLLLAVREAGREVVGFDLVEVCPGPSPHEPEWDANVGARVLYKLCGMIVPR